MQFLADECCDGSVPRALLAAGHDVLRVRDIMAGADDVAVVELAVRESRILLTEDKDFGQLVYAAQKATGGVILIRYPASARASLAQAIVELVAVRGEDLHGRFVVAQPGRNRLGKKRKDGP